MEIVYHLSQFKFDGKGRIIVLGHMCQVIHFYHSNGIHCNYVMGRLFTLTLEYHVKKWFHMLPTTSIHSFKQLIRKLCQAFDRDDSQDVHRRKNQLILKPKESLKDFSARFVHIFLWISWKICWLDVFGWQIPFLGLCFSTKLLFWKESWF